MPHTLLGPNHAGSLLKLFRTNRGLTRRDIGRKLWVSAKTVQNRELGVSGLNVRTLIEHAALFDYSVVLVKRRRPGARPTGTGWPTA